MKEKFVEKQCKHHGLTPFVLENRGAYRCMKCRAQGVLDFRRRIKARAVAHLGGVCLHCGFDGHPAAFDFHHRDPTQKDFMISSANAGWERLKTELDKCDLLCANCHRVVHAG